MYPKDPNSTTIYEKVGPPTFLSLFTISQVTGNCTASNANQFPKQQPNPFTWESFQEVTKVLMFGKKAEALSSHTSPYIWPPLALQRSAYFEARIWEFRSGREEQYLFHILQESGRLKARPLNLQLAFLCREELMKGKKA